ncbi:TPA: hypothetical protein ACX42Z_001685 [Escherichia coli]|uniref:hypothetical protein n=1 Tax=Escherichia coli TaxID=562 RepID=UPI0001DC66FE|nr:hypothetical protein [Escherichia coli]EFK26903.1 hypothetical protein HMPREF9550_00968 [Escherichia coli MS 187-1]MDQ8132448.1 hypothetical protein [Escherichia coli]
MTRKEYIKDLAAEIIRSNQPLINRIVMAEVDKIKAQLASIAPNAAERSRMLAVMGSNSALGVYLAKTDELAGLKSDIATNAFTASQQAPDPRDYFGENLDDFTRDYFSPSLDDFTRQYWDGDDETNKRISEYFDAPNEISGINLDDFFGSDYYSVSRD